ncbi:MAG: hypothetical protein V4632_06390 [Pseudomonadota bacterium]
MMSRQDAVELMTYMANTFEDVLPLDELLPMYADIIVEIQMKVSPDDLIAFLSIGARLQKNIQRDLDSSKETDLLIQRLRDDSK